MYRDKLRKHLTTFKKSDYLKVQIPGKEMQEILIDCSFGVNPFGHTENIKIQNQNKVIEVSDYPKLGAFDLKSKIIDFWRPFIDLTFENIAVSDGSMGSINSLNSLYIDVGDKILGYSPQFPEFIDSLEIRGGEYLPVLLSKENNYKFSSEDIINSLDKDTYKLVYIDNPNNPTGQIIPLSDIEKIIQKSNEQNTIVIIDEAYGDYMPLENSAINLMNQYPNFYVLKSFSKAYALAGLRVGYIIASEELMNNYALIDDYLINRVALEVSIEALADIHFIFKSIEKTRLIKSEIINSIRKLNVLETDLSVPIFTIVSSNENINLYQTMRDIGINTTSGFHNLKQNSVRVRIPTSSMKFIELLRDLESII